MEKEKGKIRAQMIRSLEAYRGKPDFTFFDAPNAEHQLGHIQLDDNDLEVLQMNLSDSSWILLTTKCLFIHQNEINNRINGPEIKDFYFLNRAYARNKKKMPEFENPAGFKSWFHSGDFKIVKNNDEEIMVNLPHHDFGFCLLKAIDKLRFVSKRYIGI